MQVGLSPGQDAERLRTVRDEVGPAVEIMLDANQRIPSQDAAAWAAALAPYRPYWLEEPIVADCHSMLADIRRSSTISIAAGESESERGELEDLLERDAVDVIQPDVYRAGVGTTREIIAEASGRNVMAAPHMAHEISAHLMSGNDHGGWVEYFDWFDDWWQEPVVPRRGLVVPAARPGHGLQFRPGWLDAHAI
jgi:L-alanine-DL-glutamate epimerase-like enolase superfamily enzyme